MPYVELGLVAIIAGLVWFGVRAHRLNGKLRAERDRAVADFQKLRQIHKAGSAPLELGADAQSDIMRDASGAAPRMPEADG